MNLLLSMGSGRALDQGKLSMLYVDKNVTKCTIAPISSLFAVIKLLFIN